jgi:predicted transcriptional regulator
MSTTQLSRSQKSILETLVERTDDDTRLVKGEQIAEEVDRTPGTIRQQMQSLRALQLVEGVPGPKGGYKPTATAYRRLDTEEMDTPAEVPVEVDGKLVDDITVTEIDFVTVHNPDLCRAEVSLNGPLYHVSEGDRLAVGPTPSVELRLSGTVAAVTPREDTITLDVRRMRTPTN